MIIYLRIHRVQQNMSIFLFPKKKNRLDSYQFPVYTTKSCPGNLTEYRQRLATLEFNKDTGYMCVPNEQLTGLLEFSYSLSPLNIDKGTVGFRMKLSNHGLKEYGLLMLFTILSFCYNEKINDNQETFEFY